VHRDEWQQQGGTSGRRARATTTAIASSIAEVPTSTRRSWSKPPTIGVRRLVVGGVTTVGGSGL
jgi:hypothetical protein